MKKKLSLFFAMMLISVGMAWAEETFTGVLVTTPDGAQTYALTESPRISYETDGTTYTAKLFLKSKAEAVATVILEGNHTLKTQWGTYTPTGINGVTSDKFTTYQRDGKKFFTGGKIIIIDRDGKKYDASGREIK